jgi:uncharacterized DUF497 family protein
MFEWDERKRQLTIEKHNLDFADAVEIFFGPHLLLGGRSEVENRNRAVAQLGGKVICVVFTQRGDVTRIITARAARRDEREKYQALLSGRNQGDEGPDRLEGPHQ